MVSLFELKSGQELEGTRIETIDAVEDLCCYGDSKGSVSLCNLQASDSGLSIAPIESVKMPKKIDKAQILKLTKFVAVLSGGKVSLLDPATLTEKHVLVKSGASNFAINANDYISISSGKKVVVHFFNLSIASFAAFDLGKGNEAVLPDTVLKMTWNKEMLGMVLKKNYMVLGLGSKKVFELLPTNNAVFPCLLVYKENWIAVSQDNVMFFEYSGKPIAESINIKAPSPIFDMCVCDYYLVILRATSAEIYNLLDYTRVQAIELEKGWVYKDLTVDEKKIYVAQATTAGMKKEESTMITYLKEIPKDIVINKLLLEGQYDDAMKIFNESSPPGSPNYEAKKDKYHIDAAWLMLKSLMFPQSISFFQKVNYDPRELLALIPDMVDPIAKPFQTLKNLVEAKITEISKPDEMINEGTKAVITLIEEKRKFLIQKYDIAKEFQKKVAFLYSTFAVNPGLKEKDFAISKIMEIIDNSLIKLYVETKQPSVLHAFLENTPTLKFNEGHIDAYLKAKQDKDKSYTTHLCQALLVERKQEYESALMLYKTLGEQAIKDIREISCRQTVKILMTKIKDKKIFFKYAKMIIVMNPDEGLKLFTSNPALAEVADENDILTYLESFESFQPIIKERYLEHLVKKDENDERFHTLLALLYVGRIKEAKKKDKNPTQEQVIATNKKSLQLLLRNSKNYNAQAILDEIKDCGLFEIEIYLYSQQKRHAEALASLVEMGKPAISFSEAENYCLKQEEPLLAFLFEKIIEVYYEHKKKEEEMAKDKDAFTTKFKEFDAIRKTGKTYESYCKMYLKRFATNEKMDAQQALMAIPGGWSLKGVGPESGDDLVLQYLASTFNDRLGKEINCKIARNASEMQQLNLESIQKKLQKAYVLIGSENICKACNKKLSTGKSFYVFPNGKAVHQGCAKEPTVCPVTNVNFAKKVYDDSKY